MTHARWPRYAAAALGFLWFLVMGGGRTINPLTTDWLMNGDWLQHWLGSLFFRESPWTFPLGSIPSLIYPLGSNIGFTDSNPLLSLALKPFAAWIAPEFQFIGLWLASCWVLQGYMGAALASLVTPDRGQQVLGGFLFVLSPALLSRINHDTLCAHWIVLGLLYLGLREYPDRASVRRGTRLTTGAVVLSSLIHPYLAAICYVMAIAVFIRLWRARLVSIATAALTAAGATVAMLAVFYCVGYFGEANLDSAGFGEFSSDLLTFVNPYRFSNLLRPTPMRSSQGEGLAFLGLGGLIAVGIAAFVLVRRRPRLPTGTGAIFVAAILLGIYALSQYVSYGGVTVINLDWLYSRLEFIIGPFRASGRFIWPLHYLVMLAGLWGLTRLFRGASSPSAATALLGIVVALQAGDLRVDRSWGIPKRFRQVPVGEFTLAQGKFRHLALYPTQIVYACGHVNDEHAYRYMLHAYRLKLTFNSGIFARLPAERTKAECAKADEAVRTGQLDPQTIYVVDLPYLEQFRAYGAACRRFDGDWICVSKDSDDAFRKYLDPTR